MGRLQKIKSDEYSSFLRVLFGLTSPSPVAESGDVEWIDPSLNGSQKDAIKFALGSREVALIHGPPGVSFLTILKCLFTDTLKRLARPIH